MASYSRQADKSWQLRHKLGSLLTEYTAFDRSDIKILMLCVQKSRWEGHGSRAV